MDAGDEPEHNHIDPILSLADASFSAGQLLEAATLFEAACLMLREAGVSDSPKLRHCITSMAEIYSARDNPAAALEFIEALRKLDDSIDNRRWYVSLLDKIANTYEMQGAGAEADAAYREALASATELLPGDDPLIESLSGICIKLQRRPPKSDQLTTSDRIKLLSKILIVQPLDATFKQVRKPARSKPHSAPANRAPAKSALPDPGKARVPSFSQSYVLLICLSLVLMACFLKAALFVPVIRSPTSTANVIAGMEGIQFESCDKKSAFCLFDKSQCAIKSPNLRTKCRYTVIDNALQDLTSMLRGYLTRDELWYQVSAARVIDPDQTLLYPANAPELTVVSKMWWYADFAQKWFNQKHFYPSDVEKCKTQDSDFQFLNPFTFHQDAAAIISLKGMPGDASWSVRPQNLLAYPHWRPGGIYCVCSDSRNFYIHGCDRGGRPLTASDPQAFFVIECLDGTDVTKAKLLKEDEQAQSRSSNKPLRVFVCLRPEQEATIVYLRSLSCAVAWILALLASLWCLSTFKLKQSLALKAVSLLVTLSAYGILATWYVLAFAGD